VSEHVVILGAARTPFGAFGGPMRDMSIPELGSIAASAAMHRADVSPNDIDEFAMGVNLPGSDRSIARQTALRSGIPDDRTSYTVDRACCSSLTAVSMARRGLLSGDAQIAVAGGGENLSRVPYFLEGVRFGARLGDLHLGDQLVISCPFTGVARAVQASLEAELHGISRAEQDEWALRSQQRAAAAQRRGAFESEIVPLEVDIGRTRVAVTDDESIRADSTIERLSSLATVNGSTTVTAGNAPALSTGAAFVVLSGQHSARAAGRTPLATIVASVQVAGHPARIGSIPAVAVQAVLNRAGLTLDDIDLFEINEAFAAVPLISTLVLADGDRQRADKLRQRTNVNGGAIALGHPTGATGVRLVMTAAAALRAAGGGRALIAMCGGVGEGEAVIIEVDSPDRS
jgi:acetyl-CoA C-acetyltransferase